jgi:membrane-bound metal-dependent hydrolase YbcI (DUF457 family)
MPDLLTHVLAAYVVGTLAARRMDYVANWHVPILMIGSVLPDLSKLYLAVSEHSVSGVIGAPFSWEGLHTLGPIVFLSLAGALLFCHRHQRTAFAGLISGAVLHLGLDSLLIRADGHVPSYFFPITWWQYPSGNVYLSSDIWLSLCAVVGATAVFLIDR